MDSNHISQQRLASLIARHRQLLDDLELFYQEQYSDMSLAASSDNELAKDLVPVFPPTPDLEPSSVHDEEPEPKPDPEPPDKPSRKRVTIEDLVKAGLLKVGDRLFSVKRQFPAEVRIDQDYKLVWKNKQGETIRSDTPSEAAGKVQVASGGRYEVSGWDFWKTVRKENRLTLKAIKERYENSLREKKLTKLKTKGYVSDGGALTDRSGTVFVTVKGDKVQLNGEVLSLSAAAQQVSGSTWSGWDYWGKSYSHKWNSLNQLWDICYPTK